MFQTNISSRQFNILIMQFSIWYMLLVAFTFVGFILSFIF